MYNRSLIIKLDYYIQESLQCCGNSGKKSKIWKGTKEENPHCSRFKEANLSKHIHVAIIASFITSVKQAKLPQLSSLEL